MLTLLDAWSRYLLRCEAVLNPDGVAVERILDSFFQEFGLPAAIRYDNGPPFASTGAAGLTRLSVWWLQRCNLAFAWRGSNPASPSRTAGWSAPISLLKRSSPLLRVAQSLLELERRLPRRE